MGFDKMGDVKLSTYIKGSGSLKELCDRVGKFSEKDILISKSYVSPEAVYITGLFIKAEIEPENYSWWHRGKIELKLNTLLEDKQMITALSDHSFKVKDYNTILLKIANVNCEFKNNNPGAIKLNKEIIYLTENALENYDRLCVLEDMFRELQGNYNRIVKDSLGYDTNYARMEEARIHLEETYGIIIDISGFISFKDK